MKLVIFVKHSIDNNIIKKLHVVDNARPSSLRRARRPLPSLRRWGSNRLLDGQGRRMNLPYTESIGCILVV